ncbi:MAG: ABC transporter substrate-binding protein, partial [Arenicellales bacterium]
IAGDAAEGVIITTSLDRDSNDPLAQAFITGFQAKSGYPADMVSASTHTAVLVLAEALKQVDPSDKAALRQAIASTSINAATGNISFNKLGEVKKSVQVQ